LYLAHGGFSFLSTPVDITGRRAATSISTGPGTTPFAHDRRIVRVEHTPLVTALIGAGSNSETLVDGIGHCSSSLELVRELLEGLRRSLLTTERTREPIQPSR
jgi:hypothetical protein